ncbi:MAG TPA: hypothetical protein VM656_03185 [Pyrinomonadaceae bacterium]|nr:hypothetical protein [Pyrinomonadaceae bacterium]
MKPLIPCILLSLCMVQAISAQESRTGSILAPDKYDEWGDVPFATESARLDKIARQLKEWPLSVVYLAIHAGQTACKGEAEARGIRAKDYLTQAGIEPERIVWIDAGWQKKVVVQVWIWPPQLGRPKPETGENLKSGAVRIERGCKIKHRPEPRTRRR